MHYADLEINWSQKFLSTNVALDIPHGTLFQVPIRYILVIGSTVIDKAFTFQLLN